MHHEDGEASSRHRATTCSFGEKSARNAGCFVCGRLGHAAKDCKLNQGNGKGQSKEKKKIRLTRTVPPSLKVSVAIVARKVTSGQTARNVWQKRKT